MRRRTFSRLGENRPHQIRLRENHPAKSSAYERPSAAEMAAAPTAASTTPREHGRTSERNNYGKSCKRRGDFPEG